MHRNEGRFVIRPGKCSVCRRVRTPFSPEILQAWASEGVKKNLSMEIHTLFEQKKTFTKQIREIVLLAKCNGICLEEDNTNSKQTKTVIL